MDIVMLQTSCTSYLNMEGMHTYLHELLTHFHTTDSFIIRLVYLYAPINHFKPSKVMFYKCEQPMGI